MCGMCTKGHFYLRLNGRLLTAEINIKMIVENVKGTLSLSETVSNARFCEKYKICFTVAFPSYSASAVWSWFSFHCSG